jgi:hypothetical protein
MFLKMLIQLKRLKNLMILVHCSVSKYLYLIRYVFFIYLVPNECLNEIDGIRHFERVFQDRHPNVPRWPVWFKSSLENAINQSVKHYFLCLCLFLFIHSMVHSLSFSIMMNLLLPKYFLVKFFVHHRF